MQGSEVEATNSNPEGQSKTASYSSVDERFYRATFKTRYPKDKCEFPDKPSLEQLKVFAPGQIKYDATAKHIHLAAKEAKIDNVTWRECRFHWPKDTRISDIKFKDCVFIQCFLGSVEFNRVTFHNCQFVKCEFSYTRFIECNFENCSWEDCSLWDAHFKGSLIDPDAILSGFSISKDNLTNIDNALKEKRLKLLVQSRVDLAEQLSRSNDERRSALYSDRSISAYRRENLKLRRAKRIEYSGVARWYQWVKDLPSFLFFHLTDGGVSLRRLFLSASILIVSSTSLLYIFGSHMTYRGIALGKSFSICIEASFALMLAFGYTNFNTGTPSNFPPIIIIFPIIGIFWLSLTLAVVVRRVYR